MVSAIENRTATQPEEAVGDERPARPPARWNLIGQVQRVRAALQEQAQNQRRLMDELATAEARLQSAVAALQKRADGVDGRLDNADAAQRRQADALAGQLGDLSAGFQDLHGGFGRLDRDLVSGLARQDTVLSDLATRLSTSFGQVTELARSVDAMAVATMFGADWRALAGPHAVPVDLDFPACVERAFPKSYPAAAAACDEVLEDLQSADMRGLVPHWPNTAGFDWTGYVRLSLCRMVRVLDCLAAEGRGNLSILDYGAFFGNFSLMASGAGHAVTSVDSYESFGPGFAPFVRRLKRNKVAILDTGAVGFDLAGVADQSFDVVMAMSVIEHVPHTPRHLIETLRRVLKPGGVLLVETPNLGYVFNRMKLLRGESVWPAIASQYRTEVPFAGHHREYTRAEMHWMLEEAGFAVESEELFNYSIYASDQHAGQDLMLIRAAELDPDKREIIMMRARKPA